MLLSNMKQQLNDCKMGRVRNFRFGSILSMFLFERVPRRSPRVDIAAHGVWDPESETFQIDGMSLNIKVEDIYFITGLSRQGEMVNIQYHGPGGGLTIDE